MNTYTLPRNTCPSCGSCNLQCFYQHKFEPIEGGGLFDHNSVTICDECGMAFANNLPSQATVDNYYKSDNKYESTKFHNIYSMNAESIFTYIKNKYEINSKIADFGCGMGQILRELHDIGYKNLTGIDTSKVNCNALNKLGINTLNKSAFNIETSDFPYELDAIICKTVLEHIVDVNGFMSAMCKSLSNCGELIISVPNMIAAGDIEPFREFSTEHINFFTLNSLSKLMSRFQMYPSAILTPTSNPVLNVVYTNENDHMSKWCQAYVSSSKKNICNKLMKLDRLIFSQAPVIIYGVGTLTRYLIANTQFSKLNIQMFADSDKHLQGKCIAGKTIVAPGTLKNHENATIVLSTYEANNAIEQMLRDDYHLSNAIISL